MEIDETDNLTTLTHKLNALQLEFSVCAKIGYEYTVKGEQLEQKIDEIQKTIMRVKNDKAS